MKPNFNLKSGIEDSDTHRRCSQTQCIHYRIGGCPICVSCKSPEYIVKKDCQTCFDCEFVPDNIRTIESKSNKDARKKMVEVKVLDNC